MTDRKTLKTVTAVCAVAMAAGLAGAGPGAALADGSGYTFKQLATIPGMAPGGGGFINDFEPYAINAGGNAAFVADVDTGGEGIFVSRKGNVSQIARAGQPAPGGNTFEIGALGHTPLNNAGDGAFIYILDANNFQPFGLNSGLFRFSLLNQAPTAVVLPGMTPAPVPAGAKFAGVYFDSSLNNRGDLVFNGVVPGLVGPPKSGGFGVGVFKADRWNHIASVVVPGDKAPGGGVFDDAIEGWINDPGDIAFDAHVKGEECIDLSKRRLRARLRLERLQNAEERQNPVDRPPRRSGAGRRHLSPGLWPGHERRRRSGLCRRPDPAARPLAEPSECSATRRASRPPSCSPAHPCRAAAISRPRPQIPYQYYLNNAGDITFVAALDTADANGVADTGLYLVSHGKIRLVARSGSDLPGVGTVAHVNSPSFLSPDALQPSGRRDHQRSRPDILRGYPGRRQRGAARGDPARVTGCARLAAAKAPSTPRWNVRPNAATASPRPARPR